VQRRTLWIIGGIALVAAMLLCTLIGAGGFLLFRSANTQARQVNDGFATMEAELNTSQALPNPPALDEATAAPLPTTDEDVMPTPVPPAASDATDVPPAPFSNETPTSRIERPPPANTNTTAPVDMPSGQLPDFSAALAPETRGKLAQFPNATTYQINARLDPAARTISGAQVVHVTNTENAPLNEIYFRLYPNAAFYNEGNLAVQDVQINGAPAQTALEVNDTALKIALPQPLAPGQQATFSMRFVTTVPTSGGYGIFRFANGIFSLYNWHPELAVYENGGWLLNPVTEQGDPTNTDASNYSVTFSAPDGYQIVTSGMEAEPARANGETTYQIVSALTRNFVVVSSNLFQSASQQVGNVMVNSYYLPKDEQSGKAALQTAASSIDLFSRQFGAYAYPEMDVMEAPLGGGAAGMESTGLIMLGEEYYDPEQSNQLRGLETLVPGADKISVLGFVTAHETAHQWWYGVIGSDAYKQPWLDESLTNWSAAFYYDKTAGEQAGALARDLFISTPYMATLAQGDEKLDQPVDRFNETEYSAIVYGKGAVMYDALRKQIGDEKFFAFLQRYYQQHEFGRVDGQEWEKTLAEVMGQEQADAFYQKWVEGTSITPADLPPGGPLSQMFGNMGGLNQLVPTPAP
jgi:hypothetical protein